MVNAPSVSSLDDDVKTKEAFKFSSELQRKAQNWICAVLQDDTLFAGSSFVAGLKSGVLLCRYASTHSLIHSLTHSLTGSLLR